jgi:hypothetical protein
MSRGPNVSTFAVSRISESTLLPFSFPCSCVGAPFRTLLRRRRRWSTRKTGSHAGAWEPGETNRTYLTFLSLPALFEKLRLPALTPYRSTFFEVKNQDAGDLFSNDFNCAQFESKDLNQITDIARFMRLYRLVWPPLLSFGYGGSSVRGGVDVEQCDWFLKVKSSVLPNYLAYSSIYCSILVIDVHPKVG